MTSAYMSPDALPPNVRTETTDTAGCHAVNHCSERDWSVRFAVQDEGLGLFAARVTALGGSGGGSPLLWWRENHAVGSREPVRVGAVVSCCTLAVSLEVEDMAANQMRAEEALPEAGMNWRIVVGVSVGVGVLVVILVGVFGTCLYRKKYHNVPQDGL